MAEGVRAVTNAAQPSAAAIAAVGGRADPVRERLANAVPIVTALTPSADST